MKKKRRTYTREFKVEAVQLVTKQEYSIAEAAESLGVSANSIRTWKKMFEQNGNNAFPGNGKLAPADEEVRRLREEVKRLRMERDILKKATAFFANEPN
jgi:transposase